MTKQNKVDIINVVQKIYNVYHLIYRNPSCKKLKKNSIKQ